MENKIDLKDKLILVCGKRNTGKTFYTSWLLKKYKDQFDLILVISPTAKFGNDWDFINDKFVKSEYNEELVKHLIKKNSEYIQNGLKKHILIILDDVTGEIDTQNDKLFKLLATRGRHYHISVILIAQHVKSLASPVIRDNLDYIFILKSGRQSIDTLYELVCYSNNKNEFIKFVNQNTNDYNVLIYDNSKSDEVWLSDRAETD